jgi:hypothetical protein
VEKINTDWFCKMFCNSAKGMLPANLKNIELLTHGGQYIVRLAPQAAGFRKVRSAERLLLFRAKTASEDINKIFFSMS